MWPQAPRTPEQDRDKLSPRVATFGSTGASVLFRLRHQDASPGRHSAYTIRVPHVALEQRQHAPRYADHQHHLEPGRPENHPARSFEERGNGHSHAACGRRPGIAGSSKNARRTGLAPAPARRRSWQEHDREPRSRGQALHFYPAAGPGAPPGSGETAGPTNAENSRARVGRAPETSTAAQTAAAHRHRSLDQRKTKNARADKSYQPRGRANHLLQAHLDRRTSSLSI